MAAAEDAFDAARPEVRRGRDHHRERQPRAARAVAQGARPHRLTLSTCAPTVKTHDLDIPRIGYIHSWTRTQDEGWVRAALDTYGVPYQYFGENALAKMGDLRAKFDVILYPARRQRRGRRRTRWSRRWCRRRGRSGAVQEHEGIPLPRLPRFDRRRSRRARRRRHEGAV